ncbi:hypothetical protein Amal_00506 [Acetobacter malorum]|uniref:Uncharacterized protein n=1 Tax=Acetobacter malorum TaxID=178901 RepID=A0A177GE26_9PROT|nr:hypothetical protein [Acetobacter malorum]OAG78493.1 hypothetical protein Amal_00506 [Acetobacter malorum]
MSQQNAVRKIVAKFGGLKKAAAALGHKNHSTIYGWVRSGRIPLWRQAELQNALVRLQIEIPHETYCAAFGHKGKSESAVA